MRAVVDTNVIVSADVVEFLEALAAASVLVPGRRHVRASRDPDDDKFLAAALEARAAFVVSGDRDLLAMRRFRSVRIVRPATFLRVLRTPKRSRLTGPFGH